MTFDSLSLSSYEVLYNEYQIAFYQSGPYSFRFTIGTIGIFLTLGL
jgi:hypothetical protein